MKLRVANNDDREFVYDVRNHPEVRPWCGDVQFISYETHVQWYADALEDSTTLIWIAEEGVHGRVGYLRMALQADHSEVELSYAIAPWQQGRGYATDLLMQGIAVARLIVRDGTGELRLVARTKVENTVSRSVLETAGFTLGTPPLMGWERWELKL